MGRMNARAAPSQPEELTAWTIKICEGSEYEAIKEIMSTRIRQRDIKVVPGVTYQLSEPSKKMAAVAQMYGQTPSEACMNCQMGKGPFSECIALEGHMGAKCAGCHYLQNNCYIANAKFRLPRQRSTRTTSKRKLTDKLLQPRASSSAALVNDSKRLKLCATSISPVVPGSNTDILICGLLYLPNPKYCSLPQIWMDLISSLEAAFRVHSMRDLSTLQARKPIQDLEQAFEHFKTKERNSRTEQGHQHQAQPHEVFVRPSGELTSPLTHLLHQPSITTLNTEEDAETADYSNGCLRQIMNNAYTDDTFVVDWLHRRHKNSRGFKVYSVETLNIHEQFTMDILESLDSKVILVYGRLVQQRILTHPQLKVICLPCWGPYEGIVIQVFLEEGFRNAQQGHKIRFHGFFLTHPQRQFYEKTDSSAARLQDVMTELAVRMTSNAVPYQRDYYTKRKWTDTNINGKELFILNQSRKYAEEEAEQWSSLQEMNEGERAGLEGAAPEKEDSWLFREKPYDIKTLQKLLPQAIQAAYSSDSVWHEIMDLPEAVLVWLEGVKHSVFSCVRALDVQSLMETYRESYQTYLNVIYDTPTPSLGADEFCKALLHIMYAQQQQISKLEDPLTHLYYVRLDKYAVKLQCKSCDESLDDDTNARWAVNRPDHYWIRRPHCHSRTCQGKRSMAVPIEDNLRMRCFHADKTARQHLLYTEPNTATTNFDRDQLMRRSREDEVSEVESWCIRCECRTQLKTGSNVYVDDEPRWTIGANPKYLERRPTCMRCVTLGRASGRFIPTNHKTKSVDMDWLNEVARICWNYKSEMREFLVPHFPPCRRDYRYGKQVRESAL